MTLLADAALAARLEALGAEELRRFVTTARAIDPDSRAVALDIAGGTAVYLGAGSPVNQAMGLGLAGRVSAPEAEQLEAFYAERGQRGFAVVCPLADHSLTATLGARGWTVDSYENVLVRPYASGERFEPARGVEIVEIADDDGRALWAQVAAIAFSAPLEPLPSQLELGHIVAARPGARLFLALVEGRPAGTGEVYVDDGIAWLSADSTLPHFRRRGVQQALQRHRLAVGAELGCELAVSESAPGSSSQRNMERLGFRVIYTRVDLIGPSVNRENEAAGDAPQRKGVSA